MPELELKRIQPNKLNPRLRFSKSGLDDLAASIKQYGILEPIIVRPVNSHFEVVVGERRYRAAQQAGLDEVPVIVREYNDDEVMEINLVENVQREDLSAVEKAKLCQELRQRYPDKYVGWDIIANRIGVDPGGVATDDDALRHRVGGRGRPGPDRGQGNLAHRAARFRETDDNHEGAWGDERQRERGGPRALRRLLRGRFVSQLRRDSGAREVFRSRSAAAKETTASRGRA